MSEFGTIIQVDDILISEDVVKEFFACDYQKCRGCCCVIGESGAPLDEGEAEPLEKFYPVYSPLMQPEGRKVVEEKGFFEVDVDGDIVTPVIPGTPGREECVYTHFDEEGNCFCSIEKCYFAGKCEWRKPASCWLYPIRITKLPGGGEAWNLHKWKICKDAFERGKRENIRAFQFLREPIEAIYGEDFYEALAEAANHLFGI